MAPRRAFGLWLHRTWRACGGCGPRDGPADAPEAALCGRAHDVAVAAPYAALLLVPAVSVVAVVAGVVATAQAMFLSTHDLTVVLVVCAVAGVVAGAFGVVLARRVANIR